MRSIKPLYLFLLFSFIFLFMALKIHALESLSVDENVLKERIEESKNFLLGLEHPLEHGFYKYYLPAKEKQFEDRLHTTYSASIIYSLLYVYEFDKDAQILERIPQWGNFLLKMQNREVGSKNYGAFAYSYFLDKPSLNNRILTINSKGEKFYDNFYLDKEGKELYYVVGTNSKTIFTLLRLYEYTKDERYLDSAKLAGDWLLTMQNNDGTMKSYSRYRDGKWYFGNKESFLYDGQALSAFSRLYSKTGEERYYSAAKKIADYFIQKIKEADGEFIKDDYRDINAISNSWIVMSLMDFYKISPEKSYQNIIFSHSQKIVENQITDKKNLADFGRYKTALSTSGNGWIAEVLTEVYRFCLQQEEGIDCQKYQDSVMKAIEWIWQYTLTKENTLNFKNPEEVIGGIWWSKNYKHIRTDSVAHSLNAYTRIINLNSNLKCQMLKPIQI